MNCGSIQARMSMDHEILAARTILTVKVSVLVIVTRNEQDRAVVPVGKPADRRDFSAAVFRTVRFPTCKCRV